MTSPIDDISHIHAIRVYLDNPSPVYIQIWRHIGDTNYTFEWQARAQFVNYIGMQVVSIVQHIKQDIPISDIYSHNYMDNIYTAQYIWILHIYTVSIVIQRNRAQ